jgi:glycosyltransferase involved in cell wall biosynthesis
LANILFLTLASMEDIFQRGIYTDLIRAIADKGHNVYVVAPRQRRSGLPTAVSIYGNIHVLKVMTGNITKVGLVEKGLTTLKIESNYEDAIKEHFNDVKFDLIVYSTPPITFERVVRHLKKKHNAKTYLILKDIFPQNAVDIGLMRNKGLMWRYFRRRERTLYQLSDIIGCMSPANMNYVLKHNPDISKDKVEIFPNSIKPISRFVKRKNSVLLSKYNIPENTVLFVYGGNLGKPQGIDFLIEVIDNFHQVENSSLMIVGSGTEYAKIEKHILSTRPVNVALHNYLPKAEYDELLRSADVGLIFLDPRFTIPNFPSRLTAYMESSIPIIAATDVNTDLKDVLIESKSGFWSVSGDLDSFLNNARRLAQDQELRLKMGLNGRIYLEEHYDVTKTVEILLKHL